jgi:hypothetical protein
VPGSADDVVADDPSGDDDGGCRIAGRSGQGWAALIVVGACGLILLRRRRAQPLK